MTPELGCQQFEERLTDFQEGALPPEQAAAMRRHAQQCGECGPLLVLVERTLRALAEIPEAEPPAALLAAIRARTIGQRRMAGWRETLRSLRGALWQPRVAMSFGMALFAAALLLNVGGVQLRQIRWSELTPHSLAAQIARGVDRSYARGAKYYNDLKLVYEIQAALQQIRQSSPAAVPGAKPRNLAHPPDNPAEWRDGDTVFALLRRFAAPAGAGGGGHSRLQPRLQTDEL